MSWDRRQIMAVAVAGLLSHHCSRCFAWTTKSLNPGLPEDSALDRTIGEAQGARTTHGATDGRPEGCMLAFGNVEDYSALGQVVSSTGSKELDYLLNLEAESLAKTLAVHPALCFMREAGSANAFATPDLLKDGLWDGSVVLGTRLLAEEQALHPLRAAAVIAVMAHEWTHILEFKQNLVGPGKHLELLADFMAGWYVGLKRLFQGARWFNDPSPAWQGMVRRGDYFFNSPQHHGTPEERGSAFAYGYQLSTSGLIRFAPKTFELGRKYFQF